MLPYINLQVLMDTNTKCLVRYIEKVYDIIPDLYKSFDVVEGDLAVYMNQTLIL
jgi:hypothetical protein